MQAPSQATPAAGAGRWLLADGTEIQGTPEQAVAQMRLLAFGCPHGTSGPLGPYAAWVAGRLGGQLSEQLPDAEAARALLDLMVLRGVAYPQQAEVVDFRARQVERPRRRR